MKLWELKYTLTDRWSIAKHIDYWWSTTQPGISTARHYWDVLFPGNYTVTDLTVSLVENPDPTKHIARMTQVEYFPHGDN